LNFFCAHAWKTTTKKKGPLNAQRLKQDQTTKENYFVVVLLHQLG